ncbi:MAG: DUF4422 domain-containing protein [Bacilli bacterium]|nr:DUF4422 domain-containing protein [Bacilli bacterium]
MDKKNTILVCTHIPFTLYANSFYKLIQAGAVNKPSFGIARDDEGDNISDKNPYYSELTALYWGWKHLDYDFLGLAHYRRYFKGRLRISADDKTVHVISEEECKSILSNYDIIVPKKRYYIIETLYDHYCRTLRPEPLKAAEEVIKDKYPEYLKEFNNLRKRRSAHMFNMLIANKTFLDKYLPWLFDVLGAIENKIDSSTWSDYEKRYMGSVSELMLDIYLRHNNIKYKEVGYLELIAFAKLRKGINYLRAKFFGKRYKKSVK